MRQVLKSKAAYSNADVQRVWQDIEQYVSRAEAETAIEEAAAETRKVVALAGGDVCYGWSGGKDSIALQVVMEAAGVRTPIIGLIPALEWHGYMDWIDAHAPEGTIRYANTAVDLHWLAKNPQYLFPATNQLGYKWTLLGTRRAQLMHQEQHRPTLQIYGRRTKDGNYIPPTEYGIHKTKALTTYSPIRYWSHELVLAVVHYSGRCLPPVYGWPEGWKTGTGSWAGRRIGDGSHDVSWANTWECEPDRVREAAEVLPGARAWLAARGEA
ncbi:hypothetical protein [Streptomyces chilikensis]|uniref:Phosphoadenosine phosphosulphate reductase domain-containing protein n=1 Tax=Streptomyces chilikensis TaxID=1194079 RepID=A0ABV3EJ99_9ACTN